MNSQLSSEQIKAEALRLGFSACGIAKAQPVEHAEALRFNSWLSQKGYADMQYMANHVEKRLNPHLLMPGVKSIVSVALNYTPAQRLPEGEPQMAAYALGHDYHEVMKTRLHQLAEVLDITDYRAFCDTAPVLERYWAVMAGIGWIGNNHQLYVPGVGSMCFLGELFLTIPLDEDQPLTQRGCGACRACIDHCPTHALTKEGFSAERCLSYLTIEHKGDIPPEYAALMGNTFYGCDLCQKVCPHNKKAKATKEPLLQANEQLLSMTRSQWLSLSIDDYRRLFKGSAVKRAKYEGLMRNIRAMQKHANNQQHHHGTSE